MFELNENLEIKKELFEGTVIYTIDNFYRDPQRLENYLFRDIPNLPLHKGGEKPSYMEFILKIVDTHQERILNLKKFMTFYQIYVNKIMSLLMLLLTVQDLKDMSLMIMKIVTGGHTKILDIMV